ncbi:hypothetical protein V3564_00265 [Bartonella sp. B12(2025)]
MLGCNRNLLFGEKWQTFYQRALDETSFELETVAREKKVRFAVSGCGMLVEPKTDASVLLDVSQERFCV